MSISLLEIRSCCTNFRTFIFVFSVLKKEITMMYAQKSPQIILSGRTCTQSDHWSLELALKNSAVAVFESSTQMSVKLVKSKHRTLSPPTALPPWTTGPGLPSHITRMFTSPSLYTILDLSLSQPQSWKDTVIPFLKKIFFPVKMGSLEISGELQLGFATMKSHMQVPTPRGKERTFFVCLFMGHFYFIIFTGVQLLYSVVFLIVSACLTGC